MISLFNSLGAYVALEPTPDAPIPPKLPTYFCNAAAPSTLHLKNKMIDRSTNGRNNLDRSRNISQTNGKAKKNRKIRETTGKRFSLRIKS